MLDPQPCRSVRSLVAGATAAGQNTSRHKNVTAMVGKKAYFLFGRLASQADGQLKLFQIVGKAQGKQLGRPRIDAAVEKRIQTQLRAGKGILKVARELGVGSGTVQRVRQEMTGPFADAAA
jgi:hypothetical protein